MNSVSKTVFPLILGGMFVIGWAASAGAFSGFIENRGQVDSRVKYYCPGPRAAVDFTQDAVVIDLKEEVKSLQRRAPHQMPQERMEAGVADSMQQKG